MGKRGPAPKPTQLRILDGSAKAHPERVSKQEPKPKAAPSDPPSWLKGRKERAVYRDVAENLAKMRLLTEADQRAVAQLAVYWVKWHELAESSTTEVTVTDTGYASTDPRINSMVKLGEKITALLKEFGMTPSSRTRIETPEEKPADPLEEYLSNVN